MLYLFFLLWRSKASLCNNDVTPFLIYHLQDPSINVIHTKKAIENAVASLSSYLSDTSDANPELQTIVAEIHADLLKMLNALHDLINEVRTLTLDQPAYCAEILYKY